MRLKKQVAAAETTMKNYQSEVDKLNHIISEADAERFRQQREYDVVINERDILGTQVPASRVAIKIRKAAHVHIFDLRRIAMRPRLHRLPLAVQLIRRNDELALLYEKIKIQRCAISQGEVTYRDRLEDLRVLRLRENTYVLVCISQTSLV